MVAVVMGGESYTYIVYYVIHILDTMCYLIGYYVLHIQYATSRGFVVTSLTSVYTKFHVITY